MGKRSRRKGTNGDAAIEPDGSAAAADGDERAEAEEPKRTLADPRLREVMAYAEEADMLYHLYRWTLLKGGVPSAPSCCSPKRSTKANPSTRASCALLPSSACASSGR